MAIADLSADRSGSHRSLQVIAEVKCVVRELVENAIDAGANDIVVKLVDNGTTAIRVTDNGKGVHESNFENLGRLLRPAHNVPAALRNTTSKIQSFEDIFTSLGSHGFRGEALNSIANVGVLEVETRTAQDDMGWALQFRSDGTLLAKNRVATTVGTTVTCRNLFEPYPVRRKLLLKGAKGHLSGSVNMVQQYALIHPDTRFALTNVSSTNYQMQNLFASPGKCTTIREAAEQIYGHGFVRNVIDVTVEGDGWKVEGVISTPQTGRQSSDIQILFVNRRPVDEMKKLKKCLKDVHRQFSSKYNVAYVLNLTIDWQQVDINLAPDKRRVLLMQEEVIMQQLKERMVELYLLKMASGSLTDDPLRLKQMHFGNSCDAEEGTGVLLGGPSQDQMKGAVTGDLVRSSGSDTSIGGYESQVAGPPAVVTDGPPTNNEPIRGASQAEGTNVDNFELGVGYGGENSTFITSEAHKPEVGTVLEGSHSAGGASEPLKDASNYRRDREMRSESYIMANHSETRDLRTYFKPAASLLKDEPTEHATSSDIFDLVLPKGGTQHYDNDLVAVNTDVTPVRLEQRTLQSYERDYSNPSPGHYPNDTTGQQGISECYTSRKRQRSDDEDEAAFGGISASSDADGVQLGGGRSEIQNHEAVYRSPGACKGEEYYTGQDKTTFGYTQETDTTHATDSSGNDGCFFNDDVLTVNMERLYNDNFCAFISQRKLNTKKYSEVVPMVTDYGMMDPKVFLKIKVCGQFNNGFIVAKLEGTEVHTDEIQYSIYLIDPHAADEKTKFEQYNAGVKIRKQPLVCPRKVELSPFHQQVVQANLELLNENGFEASVVQKDGDSGSDGQESGVYLSSFPQLMGQILAEEDFVSFVHDLAQNGVSAQAGAGDAEANNVLWGSNTIVPRPKRIWNILATSEMVTLDRQSWLHEFRRCLASSDDAAEYARFAASYNPHRRGCTGSTGVTARRQEISLSREANDGGSGCSEVVAGSVADVYNCGGAAFVRSRDVQLDLAKVYLLLSKARKLARRRQTSGAHSETSTTSSVEEDARDSRRLHDDVARRGCRDEEHERSSALVEAVVKRFERYVVICTTLAEKCPFECTSDQDAPNMETAAFDRRQQRALLHSVANFRINPADYRSLMGISDLVTEVGLPADDVNAVTVLSWPFYRDASCGDIFKLLCYALMFGNFQAFHVILDHHDPCMAAHVRDNWAVLLSYVPVVCDYARCREVVDKIFGMSQDPRAADCARVVDWVIWRTYVILESTNCSFHLALKFLKTMSSLPAKVGVSDEELGSRLRLLDSLHSFMKQHLVYCGFETGSVMSVKELETADYLTFIPYLQLKAAEKLQLFIDCIEMPGAGQADCACEEAYKDKYGVYTSCLKCKTAGGAKTLATFFQLIKTTDTLPDNEFGSLSAEFRTFFAALKQCASSPVDDYMEGVYRKLSGTLDTGMFEMLYVLTDAMLRAGLGHMAHTVVVRVLFNRSSRYNLLEHCFVYKSIFSLLGVDSHVLGVVDAYLWKDEGDDFPVFGSSLLGGLSEDPPVTRSYATSEPANPQYMEFLKMRQLAGGKLRLSLVLQAVRCQLNFVEAVLNLFSLMPVQPAQRRPVYIGIDEMTEALYSQDKAMLLMQRILLYVIEQDLPVDDFRNCLYALHDIAAYVSATSLHDLHLMVFYTLCVSCRNAGYLEAQCQLWFTSSNTGLSSVGQFLRASLCSVKAALCRLGCERHVNFALARMVTDLSRGLHEGAASWPHLKHPVSRSAMDIHGLIGAYLEFLGVDWDGEVVNQGMNVLSLLETGKRSQNVLEYEAMVADIRRLGSIQRMSTVLTSFNCHVRFSQVKCKRLSYRAYPNKRELAEDALGSLASEFFKKAGTFSPSSETYWESLVFASILSSVFKGDAAMGECGTEEIVKKLQQIRADAVLVLPREDRRGVSDVLEVLTTTLQETQPAAAVESAVLGDSIFSAVSSRLLGQWYAKSSDFVGLAKVCGQASSTELPRIMSFLKDHVFKLAAETPGDMSSDSAVLSASNITLFEVLTGPDCDIESAPDKGREFEVSDLTVRSEILKLLSRVNLAKVEVCQADMMKISFDKLAHRFTGNTASGLLSKALGKAETGLSTIAMKKMQFETLKGKFFTPSKKSTESFNGCFLPILNFYNTAVLCMTNYDFSGADKAEEARADAQDVMRWRSASHLDLLQLLRADPRLGVLMLLERCRFAPSMLFVEQLHQVFHNFNVHRCLRVLDLLRPLLRKFGWPPSLTAHLAAIETFLGQFRNFPSETDVYIGRFIASSKYRLELFGEVAEYVLDNMNAFLHIYQCLDALFSCRELGAESPRGAAERLHLGELMAALWTDAPVPQQPFRIGDPLLMNECVTALLRSFERTFWASGPAELAEKLRCVEPDFLQLGGPYRDCLLAMHREYLRRRLHRPGHWLCWRRLVCRFLAVYPEEAPAFGALFRPGSAEVVRLLEVVARTTEGFDFTEVDNFEAFKRSLARKVSLRNYFAISSAMRRVDAEAAAALLDSARSRLRGPGDAPGFYAARALYSFDAEAGPLRVHQNLEGVPEGLVVGRLVHHGEDAAPVPLQQLELLVRPVGLDAERRGQEVADVDVGVERERAHEGGGLGQDEGVGEDFNHAQLDGVGGLEGARDGVADLGHGGVDGGAAHADADALHAVVEDLDHVPQGRGVALPEHVPVALGEHGHVDGVALLGRAEARAGGGRVARERQRARVGAGGVAVRVAPGIQTAQAAPQHGGAREGEDAAGAEAGRVALHVGGAGVDLARVVNAAVAALGVAGEARGAHHPVRQLGVAAHRLAEDREEVGQRLLHEAQRAVPVAEVVDGDGVHPDGVQLVRVVAVKEHPEVKGELHGLHGAGGDLGVVEGRRGGVRGAGGRLDQGVAAVDPGAELLERVEEADGDRGDVQAPVDEAGVVVNGEGGELLVFRNLAGRHLGPVPLELLEGAGVGANLEAGHLPTRQVVRRNVEQGFGPLGRGHGAGGLKVLLPVEIGASLLHQAAHGLSRPEVEDHGVTVAKVLVPQGLVGRHRVVLVRQLHVPVEVDRPFEQNLLDCGVQLPHSLDAGVHGLDPRRATLDGVHAVRNDPALAHEAEQNQVQADQALRARVLVENVKVLHEQERVRHGAADGARGTRKVEYVERGVVDLKGVATHLGDQRLQRVGGELLLAPDVGKAAKALRKTAETHDVEVFQRKRLDGQSRTSFVGDVARCLGEGGRTLEGDHLAAGPVGVGLIHGLATLEVRAEKHFHLDVLVAALAHTLADGGQALLHATPGNHAVFLLHRVTVAKDVADCAFQDVNQNVGVVGLGTTEGADAHVVIGRQVVEALGLFPSEVVANDGVLAHLAHNLVVEAVPLALVGSGESVVVPAVDGPLVNRDRLQDVLAAVGGERGQVDFLVEFEAVVQLHRVHALEVEDGGELDEPNALAGTLLAVALGLVHVVSAQNLSFSQLLQGLVNVRAALDVQLDVLERLHAAGLVVNVDALNVGLHLALEHLLNRPLDGGALHLLLHLVKQKLQELVRVLLGEHVGRVPAEGPHQLLAGRGARRVLQLVKEVLQGQPNARNPGLLGFLVHRYGATVAVVEFVVEKRVRRVVANTFILHRRVAAFVRLPFAVLEAFHGQRRGRKVNGQSVLETFHNFVRLLPNNLLYPEVQHVNGLPEFGDAVQALEQRIHVAGRAVVLQAHEPRGLAAVVRAVTRGAVDLGTHRVGAAAHNQVAILVQEPLLEHLAKTQYALPPPVGFDVREVVGVLLVDGKLQVPVVYYEHAEPRAVARPAIGPVLLPRGLDVRGKAKVRKL
ncbi:DNA mismatch repair protein, putative [Babesia caballi]|uniref:DNA mismatch repair protein, putative n=1 Tax=Babesia caballi TaxID=5871 RepID=A0AAV4LXA8_BABCB|nr:DNA mismatch repair protein, putative [Babesia caballi]